MALRVVWAVDQWCAIAALLGFAYRLRHADSPLLRYLTLAVFPLYILHQSVIVVLAHKLKPLQLEPGIEAVILIAATFVLCLVAFELIRRCAPLRPLFGLPAAAAVPSIRPMSQPAGDQPTTCNDR